MFRRLWEASAPLTVTGLVMMPVLAVAIAGLFLDQRVIADAPAWLKPAKFAVSIAIYSFTLAGIFSVLPAWGRTRTVIGWMTAVTMVLEIAIISAQAFRGTTSHFNVATPLDTALFSIMGAAILVQTCSTVAVAVALWRQPFADRALGWALRLGMVITIVGAMSGGLMTPPTRQQLEAARRGEPMTVAGAHTVGAPDGGPGLPGTGWSATHGDLRVAHFIGLHALQFLPLVALALSRRRFDAEARVRLTLTSAVSYTALFGIVLSQALRGQSLLAPDALTLVLVFVWMFGTALAVAVSTLHPQPARQSVAV